MYLCYSKLAPGSTHVELLYHHQIVGCVAQLAERRSLVGEQTDPVLRSACSRRVTTMWVNRPLQVSQLSQLSLSSFRG